MNTYERREQIIQVANGLIQKNEGAVVFATNSRKEAKALERLYVDLYGDDAVYMICGDNSDTREARSFIHDINERLPKLKVFIYTPSLVRRLLSLKAFTGVFGSEWMSPDIVLTEADIATKMRPFLDSSSRSLRNQLNRRSDGSDNHIDILRWMLHRVGLSLRNDQVMRKRKRVYVYFLDPELVHKMQGYAQTRLARLNDGRKARREEIT